MSPALRRRLCGGMLTSLALLVVGVDTRYDVVLFRLPVTGAHGIHLTDLAGVALMLAGIALLWTATEARDA